MSQLVIREAAREDAPQILEFIKDLADYEKMSDEVVATVEDIEQTVFAEQPKAYCLIAEWEGQSAGFALYFYSYSTFLGKHGIYLEDLFVKPEFRGKRIGMTLLKRLSKIAVDNDCKRMDWSVLDWNKPAIEFYDSIGAKPQKEWLGYRLTGEALSKFAE
ncbi:GNAT family N-acetyltransferase [Kangiella sediminilitoris]|uniref:GCN5 family N-acetyltransferase n=1 Tax=Kangiella sediminilitoris TaxID=1144748 RepID=A0A1B3B9E3_9GAMM|nr:GNAT family N-acetyltransferase [Kangiella sediminilitoris]AOE49423.1 GCN5 family N-acetyltransferase [Kangiella sediminilitoris]